MIRQDRTLVGRRPQPLVAWDSHPFRSNAVRAAVAGAIAWWLTALLPAPLNEYPYYAPMGAVLAVSTNPVASVRTALQAAAAIGLGGLVAIGVDTLGDARSVPVMAAAVLVAMLLSGLRFLGTMGSLVPTAAIFALLLGGGEATFVWAYATVVSLGALVTLAVTLVSPGQPLILVGRRLGWAREALAARIEDCIRELQDPYSLAGPDDHGIARSLDLARATMDDVMDSRRGNPRVRRHREKVELARNQLRAWERINTMLGVLIEHGTSSEPGRRVLAEEVATETVDVLCSLASVLRATTVRTDEAELEACRRAVQRLRELLTEQAIPWSPVASTVVLFVEAVIADLTPPEGASRATP